MCMCLVWVVVVVFGVVGVGSSTGVRPWGMTFPSAREYVSGSCACVRVYGKEVQNNSGPACCITCRPNRTNDAAQPPGLCMLGGRHGGPVLLSGMASRGLA